MLLQELENKNLIHPPEWLSHNCHYLSIMGSVAYGVSSDTSPTWTCTAGVFRSEKWYFRILLASSSDLMKTLALLTNGKNIM